MTAPAHEAIRNLLGTYCELIDAGELEQVADLFADAVIRDDAGNEIARGRDGAHRLFRGTVHLYDGSPRTRHLTTNTVIDVDEDAGTATARSSFVVLQATDALALQPILVGRYRDRFGLSDGRWTFAERAFAIDLMGDVSAHMRYTPTA